MAGIMVGDDLTSLGGMVTHTIHGMIGAWVMTHIGAGTTAIGGAAIHTILDLSHHTIITVRHILTTGIIVQQLLSDQTPHALVADLPTMQVAETTTLRRA